MQGDIHSTYIMSLSPIQKTLFKNFNYILRLLKPNKEIRSKLWKLMIPKKTPISSDLNFNQLSSKYPKFVHSDIKKTIINASSIACLRKDLNKRILNQNDLLFAAKQLQKQKERDGLLHGLHHMYS